METVTIRVRSLVWFATGALLSAAVVAITLGAWRADAAPGDDDATFVPITPCRLADTRPAPDRVGTAAAFGPGGTQTFTVHGTNGECTVPTEAVAVSTNVTALGATEQTYLTFWPDGTRPLAASLNPAPGEPPTPNAVTVALSASGTFDGYNDAGTVNTVIDVNGYYVASSLEELAQRLAAVEAKAASNAADVASLEASLPFTVSAFDGESPDEIEPLTTDPTDYLSLDVTAPVDGQVSLTGLAFLRHLDAGGDINCLVAEASAIPASPTGDPAWPGVTRYTTTPSGQFGSATAATVFDIAAGETIEYVLACEESEDGGFIYGRHLIATFTPAP